MIRFDQIDVEDLDAIDPRIIQPLQDAQQFTYDDLNCDQESSSSVLNVSTPEDVLSPATLDVEDVKMEQCINLELYMSPIIVSGLPSTIDELNTPIFDACKEPDVKNNNMQDTTFYPFEFPAQVKQETLTAKPTTREQPKQQSSEQQQPETILQPQQQQQHEQQQQQENKNCRENNSSVIVMDDSGSIFNHNGGQQDEDDAFFIDLDEYDLLSNYQEELLEVVEPQDYALKLNVDAVASTSSATLETPDVINTICSIEKDFNFFTFDGTIVQPEDILPDVPQISTTSCKPEPISPPESSNDSSVIHLLAPKQRRRRKASEDDEDYEPPPPLKRKFKRRASTDSEDEYEPVPPKKRGRPSKTLSVSSENSEPSRYREMRDKNNEASRRSRHKRKVQEMTFEQEREELERRNVKLKAQVEELERTVAMRRNDLMTLMLNKS